MHTSIADRLAFARRDDLTQPWAAVLLDDGIDPELISDIATWRALHGVDDTHLALGPDPVTGRPELSDRARLARQLDTALIQAPAPGGAPELVAAIDEAAEVRRAAPAISLAELTQARTARDAAQVELVAAQRHLNRLNDRHRDLGLFTRPSTREAAGRRVDDATRDVDVRREALTDRQQVLDRAEDRWHDRERYLDEHAAALAAGERAASRLDHWATSTAARYAAGRFDAEAPAWLAELGEIPVDEPDLLEWTEIVAETLQWRARQHIPDDDRRALGAPQRGFAGQDQQRLRALLDQLRDRDRTRVEPATLAQHQATLAALQVRGTQQQDSVPAGEREPDERSDDLAATLRQLQQRRRERAGDVQRARVEQDPAGTPDERRPGADHPDETEQARQREQQRIAEQQAREAAERARQEQARAEAERNRGIDR
jgi:hypothetical protein